MKKLIIFLLFVLSACVTTTHQPTERIKDETIYPISIPIQLSIKPAKIDFSMSFKIDNKDRIFNGTMVASQFGESLMWNAKFNLNPRVFIETKCLTDAYGNIKECDSPIINIPLKPEERKEIDNLAKELQKSTVTPLPDKSFVSGEELFNIYKDEEGTEINMKGTVRGQGFVNNRKVVIVEVSGSANNSSDNQSLPMDGYILYDLETAHVVKLEINIGNGRGKISYKATITPLLRSQTSATPQDNATLKKSFFLDLTGIWRGPYNSSRFGPQTMTINIQQNGTLIAGTFASTTGGRGNFSGSISGNTISFVITVATPGCSGSFNGIGIVNPPQGGKPTMSFNYAGASNADCGGQESGPGVLTKQ